MTAEIPPGVPVDDPEDAEDEDLDEPRWGWIRG